MRDSAIVKRRVEKIGVCVHRAMLVDGLVRLTVDANTPTVSGELRREVPYNIMGRQLLHLAWIYFQRP